MSSLQRVNQNPKLPNLKLNERKKRKHPKVVAKSFFKAFNIKPAWVSRNKNPFIFPLLQGKNKD
jgi:hypothetical protein